MTRYKPIQLVNYDRCGGRNPRRNPTHNFIKICAAILLLSLIGVLNAEPAWFQVCDPSRKYELNTADCKLGLWLNHSIEVGCVCLHGVWILSSGFCDEDFMLLVGSGDCFNVRKKIQSVKYIGEIDQPFGEATFVVSQDFDTYVQVHHGNYSPSVGSTSSFVVSINPQGGIQRSDKQVCLTANEQVAQKPVHVFKNGRRVSDRFKAVSDEQCVVSTGYDYHLGFRDVYQGSTVISDMSIETCASSCPAPMTTTQEVKPIETRKKGRAKFTDIKLQIKWTPALKAAALKKTSLKLNPRRRTNINWNKLLTVETKQEFIKPHTSPILTRTKTNKKSNVYLFRKAMSHADLTHAREIREQSLRMIQSQMNFKLLNQPSAKINTIEFEYFQKARQIFLGVAPKDLIPPKVVNGLTRMWRLVLWESHDKFQHRENTHPVLHSRILEGLEECQTNTSRMPMFLTTGRKNKVYNTHGCLEKTERTTWFRDSNPKHAPVISLKFLPDHLKYNVTEVDVSIELAWKIFLFTFYRCADFFPTRAGEFSHMAEKIQSLFNYKILKRWFEPEDFNKAVKLALPDLDIPTFGFTVDSMVGAARHDALFSQWMERPVLPMTPPDLPHHMRKKRSRPQQKKTVSRPSNKDELPLPVKKRYMFDFWRNKATCLQSFTDPVDELGYQPSSPHCYVRKINK